MRYKWMDEYLLKKRSVTKDFQPVWNWIRYHVGGKMFAAICLDKADEPCYINLKADPEEGLFLQDQYEDIIPGYYSDKRTWISVKTEGKVPDELLMDLLDKAYDLMLNTFSKKQQRLVLGISSCGLECSACGYYKKECEGCSESQGKVFHAPPGQACPLYACAVQKHRYVSCAECQELPCLLWREVRDPGLSEEEFEASIKERTERLETIMRKGRGQYGF